MRFKASVVQHSLYKKAILVESSLGVSLFLYDTVVDAEPIEETDWETIPAAQAWCQHELAVARSDWRSIPDALVGCLPEREQPMRSVKLRTGQYMIVLANPPAMQRGVGHIFNSWEWIATIDSRLRADIRALLQDGLVIQASARIRRTTTCSLSEAKHMIEILSTEFGGGTETEGTR